MTRDEAFAQLVRIAAEILRSDGGPSMYLSDHEHLPRRVPQRWWRWLCGKLQAAEDERKGWARRIRDVADGLRKAESVSTGSEGDTA